MSARKRRVAVEREYQPDPDRCARALNLLLKSINKKAAKRSQRPREAAERGRAKPG